MSLFADPGLKTRPRAPQLADPRPPQPPAPTMTTTLPRAHNLVVWHYSGRVVTTAHQTRELAMTALKRTVQEEWATAYRAVVYDAGHRAEVARVDIEAESSLRRAELDMWIKLNGRQA